MEQLDAAFTLVVTRNLEKKIRHLCAMFPNTEWSGVMFYEPTGSFNEGNLVVYCRDLCLMDIGSAGYTEYDITPEVAGYMADHDLTYMDQGIIHSHHSMATFFSGTDTGTLQEEGSKRDVFVSLIVNNERMYSAAITSRAECTVKTSWTGLSRIFGESRNMAHDEESKETIVEWRMFKDIKIEDANDDMEELNRRITALQARKFMARIAQGPKEVNPKSITNTDWSHKDDPWWIAGDNITPGIDMDDYSIGPRGIGADDDIDQSAFHLVPETTKYGFRDGIEDEVVDTLMIMLLRKYTVDDNAPLARPSDVLAMCRLCKWSQVEFRKRIHARLRKVLDTKTIVNVYEDLGFTPPVGNARKNLSNSYSYAMHMLMGDMASEATRKDKGMEVFYNIIIEELAERAKP